MRKVIDVRNLPCPQPVIETKKALESNAGCELELITNSLESKENIERFLKTSNVGFVTNKNGADFSIVFSGIGSKVLTDAGLGCKVKPLGKSFVITKNRLGEGDEKLGGLLINAFVHTLAEMDDKPAKLFFVNSGVYLATEGSNLLQDLQKLEEGGVEIFSCGTCLDFYNLKHLLRVGKVGNIYLMTEILCDGGLLI